MTYIFVKHRADGKYEVRFTAQSGRDYRHLLMALRAYVPESMRTFRCLSRTWVIENQCRHEVELWVVKMTEEVNPAVEFFCERDKAWDATVEESYRTLHVLPSAPWEVVRSAYYALGGLCQADGSDGGEQLERLNAAYETLMAELKRDDHN
jgi:hypothetical protein